MQPLPLVVIASLASFAVGASVVWARQQVPGATRREPQFENEHMRVWKFIIMPKQPLTQHRHDHGRALLAPTDGQLKVLDADGTELDIDHRERGKAYWH